MKDRKSWLYVVMGCLAFAWWEAWQQDHVTTTGAERQVSSEVISDASKQQAVDAATSGTSNKQDGAQRSVLPDDLSLSSDTVQKATGGSALSGESAGKVVVQTDLIEATFNLRGGNIEELKLLKYPKKLDSKQPVQLLSSDQDDFYVTSSGFSGSVPIGSKSNKLDTANIVFTSEQNSYRLDKDGTKNLVVTLQAEGDGGVKFTKRYTFEADSYAIKVQNSVDNQGERPWKGRFYAALSKRQVKEKGSFASANSYTGAAISSPDRPYHKVSFKELKDNAELGSYDLGKTADGWVAFQQRYFLSVWIPERGAVYDYFGYMLGKGNGVRGGDQVGHVGLYGAPLELAAGASHLVETKLYVGPELVDQLTPLANGLDRTVDYGWLWFISNLFFKILQQLHRVIGNWGLCIIAVTILIKAAFYKLTENSYRSMARMKQLAPKLNALKERYGDDKQALSQATIELYRKEGVNPLSMGGCLPMLIQIPFFIAFYYVLSNAIEFRQSPFMLWIRDLSDKDPYYVLPILMGISMWLQQKLTPSSAMDESQAKAMMLMPVIFTVMFINFPSGLVLYWLVNNLLSIAQQWYINQKVDSDNSTAKRR